MKKGGGADLPATPSCRAFEESLSPFRSAVDSVIEAFALRLSTDLGSSLPRPLLTGRLQDEELSWDNVEEVVLGGDYLDHFHSYQKLEERDEKTMEYHVDQGLLLTFTPGLMMDLDGVTGVSEGFYVRDVSGEEHEVLFDGTDDLVFMLGDAVNQ
jgi:hypothetical protein